MAKKEGILLPVAVVAFAIVAFLLLIDFSVNDNQSQTSKSSLRRLPAVCLQAWTERIGDYTCSMEVTGWHYDQATKRCIYFSGSACSFAPFDFGDDCGRTCHTNKIDPGQPALGDS